MPPAEPPAAESPAAESPAAVSGLSPEDRACFRLRLLREAIEAELAAPTDMSDPRDFRHAVERACALMRSLHGADAVRVARRQERLGTGTFARVVTRTLEWQERRAKRELETER